MVQSQYFEQYLKGQGKEHRKTTPLWPQANGELERQNKSLQKRMRIAQAEGKEWKKELRKYLVAYRSAPHTTAGVSPAELLFGRKMCTKLPELREESIIQIQILLSTPHGGFSETMKKIDKNTI